MNPFEFALNLTPNSSGGPTPVSGVLGTAVLGQIVHGQVGGTAVVMVMLRAACAVCVGLLESVPCTVKFFVPVAVGVPEINPPTESVSPCGRLDPDTKAQL